MTAKNASTHPDSSIHLSIHPSTHLPIIHPSTIYPSICPSTQLLLMYHSLCWVLKTQLDRPGFWSVSIGDLSWGRQGCVTEMTHNTRHPRMKSCKAQWHPGEEVTNNEDLRILARRWGLGRPADFLTQWPPSHPWQTPSSMKQSLRGVRSLEWLKVCEWRGIWQQRQARGPLSSVRNSMLQSWATMP